MDYNTLREMETKWRAEEEQIYSYLDAIYNFIGEENDDFVNYVTGIATVLDTDTPLIRVLESDDYSGGARFIAFYALCIKYRRYKNYTKFKDIIERFYNLFKNEPIYWVQRAVYKKTFETDPEELNEALKLWNNIDERVKNMPAFVQAYADTVVLCFENKVLNIDYSKDEEILLETIESIEKAINKRIYPKFYSTLGRLLAIKGDYNLAIKKVKVAIDKEDSTCKDYSLRINEYELIIAQINIKKSYDQEINKLQQYAKDIQDLKSEIDKSKYDSLSFLGFFTALISFTMGTYQLIGDLDFVERVQLVLILCGAIILAFSGLRIILKTQRAGFIDLIFMILLGISIIGGALVVIPLII